MKKIIRVAAALIQNGGQYLVTQRPPGSHLELFWEFPGGKCEEKELLEDCLKRELKEELDIDVAVGSCIKSTTHEYSDRTVELHFFDCEWTGGELKAKECHGIQWLYPREMEPDQFPPADQLLIQELQLREKSKC